MHPIGVGRNAVTTDLTAGIDAIVLEVFDDHGASILVEVQIQVLPPTDPECSNLPPTAWIVAPTDGQQLPFGGLDPIGGYYASVILSGDAHDDQDPPASLVFSWRSNIEGDLGEGQVIGARLHMWMNECSLWHLITLRVTDSGGKYAEDSVNVLVLGPECTGGGG
jgi:hypothetical protein